VLTPALPPRRAGTQVSDLATVGSQMEFIITKDDSDTKDQIVLLSLRRIAVRRRFLPQS
jgi:hypothetical protein